MPFTHSVCLAMLWEIQTGVFDTIKKFYTMFNRDGPMYLLFKLEFCLNYVNFIPTVRYIGRHQGRVLVKVPDMSKIDKIINQ